MNRKIFQLFFVLVIIAAFGVIIKNYVDSIISDYNDYKLYLSKVPQTEISRLAPIRIELTREININKFPVNVPLENTLVHVKPEVDGYIYFTDSKTLEFQPNSPLKAGHEYSVKLDIEKLFPASKLKPYHYRLRTPKLSFNVKLNRLTYFDSVESATPYLTGYITFNDFVEYDNKLQILRANQKKNKLDIEYYPGSNDNILEFKISAINRNKTNERIHLFWNGSSIKSSKKDSTYINIISKDSFAIVDYKTTFFPQPNVSVKFTDPIDTGSITDSTIVLNGILANDFTINNNEIIIPVAGNNLELNTLLISSDIKGINGNQLKNNFNYPFKLFANNAYINIKNGNHYQDLDDFNSFIEVVSLNLKEVKLNVFHVPDKNMMQFLQVNNIDGNHEIKRVGKLIYSKQFNLHKLSHFNAAELDSYNLDIIGADLSESGLYNFSFTYGSNNMVFAKPDSLQQFESYFNLIFSNIVTTAKHSATDTLYLFTKNTKTNTPVKNATIEVYNYQQNKLSTLVSDSKGKAKIKIEEKNLLIRVIHNNEISYLKINPDQETETVNNSGIETQKGFLCYVEGLKKNYKPNDSIKLAILLKQNGKALTANSHYEVKLINPAGETYNTQITENPNTALIKYNTSIPLDANEGMWNVSIINNESMFTYPFLVSNKTYYKLPLNFSYSKRRNTLYVNSNGLPNYLNNLPVEISISSLKNKLRSEYPNFTFDKSTQKYDTLIFTKKLNLNKTGKGQLRLAAWLKKISGFEIKASYSVNPEITFSCDTIIGSADNILGIDALFNSDGSLRVDLLNIDTDDSKLKSSKTNLQLSNNNITIDTSVNLNNKKTIVFAPFEIPKGNFQLIARNEKTSVNKYLLCPIEKKKKSGSFEINLDKAHFFVGDSLEINPASLPSTGLLTIENGEQVFYSYWLTNKHFPKIKFGITDAMVPSAYISVSSYNASNCPNILQHFEVSPAKQSISRVTTIDAPYDWTPLKPIKYTITNNSDEQIQFLTIITNNTDSSINEIDSLFNQQLFNTIKNYCSLKTVSNQFNLTNTPKQLPFINNNEILDIQGSFILEAKESLQNRIIAPEQKGNIALKIIGFQSKSGIIFENKHDAQIYEPVSIVSNHPHYVNANDLVEFTVDIYNNTKAKDTLEIDLSNIENIDIISSMYQVLPIEANSKNTFKIGAKIKGNKGTGSIQINTKLGEIKNKKNIILSINPNPSNLTNSTSAIILPNEQWQNKIIPFGIMGTNKAVYEFSYVNIPSISKITSNLNENKSASISSILNKAFPLLYYNELISDKNIKTENQIIINETLISLLQIQNSNGSFTANHENKIWLNSYAGNYLLMAKQLGFKVNEGMLNKWVRYQKYELQRLKATDKKGSAQYYYLIYTLVLANAIDIKELNKLASDHDKSFLNSLLISNTFAVLEKEKVAKSYINYSSIDFNKQSFTLYEQSLLLNNAVTLNETEFVYQIIKRINKTIENKRNDPTEVAIALSSVLRAINESYKTQNMKLSYQINNGKENLVDANSKVNYIDIPLQFTLAKNLDFHNTNSDTIYINLWQTGQPQKVYNTLENLPKVKISNTYTGLAGSTINTLKLSKGEYFRQTISYINTDSKTQSLSVTVPIASGLKVKNYAIGNKTTSNLNYKGFINFVLELPPNSQQKITLFYECAYKGKFTAYPIKTFNNNKLYEKAFTQQPTIIIN